MTSQSARHRILRDRAGGGPRRGLLAVRGWRSRALSTLAPPTRRDVPRVMLAIAALLCSAGSCGPYEQRREITQCGGEYPPGVYSQSTCISAEDFLQWKKKRGCAGRDSRCEYENARGPFASSSPGDDSCCYAYTYVDQDSSL